MPNRSIDGINACSWKVLLFTDKKKTPDLLKALSHHFEGEVQFGLARTAAASDEV